MVKKKVIISLLVALLMIVSIIFILSKKPTTKNLREDEVLITFTVVPKDAEIFLNNQKIDNTSVIKKGAYTIKVERFGFETVTFKRDLKKSVEIPLLLTPIIKETKEWAEENHHLYEAVEAIAGQQAVEVGEKQRAAAPIINLLPIQRDPYYRIGYIHDEDENVTITIHSNDETRSYAIDKLNEIEPNTANYRYKFYNTETKTYSDNPFLDVMGAEGD